MVRSGIIGGITMSKTTPQDSQKLPTLHSQLDGCKCDGELMCPDCLEEDRERERELGYQEGFHDGQAFRSD